MKYFQFLSKIMNKYLWKNSNFSTFSRVYFYSLKSFPFYLEYHESKFLGLFCLKQATKIFQFLDQNNGLTRLFVKCLVPWDACGTPMVKIRFGCTQNCKASQKDCVKSLSIISSSKPTNHIVQNLYRLLIDLLPLKNFEIRTFLAKFVALEFSHSWFRMACSEILRDTGKSRKAT